ncbi:MAG: sterol desaturase family protein [Deltaproteobacteria bacterium]|nr:sterol desaturase family protein [Deltaproteobacteria bacterium]
MTHSADEDRSEAGGELIPSTLSGVARYFFGHWSPRLLGLAWVGSAAARLTRPEWNWIDGVIVLVVVASWPTLEWLIHVFVLHFKPKKLASRTLDLPVAKIHRLHHEDPWRLELVFIPLHVFIGLPALPVIALWIAPTLAWGLTFLSIFFALSLHYEWVHLLVHTRYKPRSWNYQRLWRNHRLHHFKNEAYWYGVTMLSGDRIMRTAPDKAKVATSATARNLLGKDEE